MIAFLRKHPKLLNFAISLLTCVNKRVLAFLNASMLLLIHLKGLDPNPPPPPPPAPPEPTIDAAFTSPNRRKVLLGAPYVPAWVAKSFRDRKEHISNLTYKPLKTIQDPPTDPPLEVSGPDEK